MFSRRLARLLAALPLAAALVSPALSPSQAAAATTVVQHPTLTASLGSGQPARDFTEPFSSPAVGDLLGNGQKEIVAGSLDGWVRVFDSNLNLMWQRNLGGAIQASPTLADLNGDGRLEIVVPDRSGWVYVLTAAAGLPDFGGHWPQHSLYGMPWANLHFTPDFFASAAVGSLYGDGTQDVVATSWDHRLYAWDASGNMLGGFPVNLWDTVSASPLLVDLEGRGQRDIVVGSDSLGPPTEPNPRGGEWWAFRPDGSLIWKRNQDEVPWSSPAAAVLNPGDPFPSVVGATGHYYAQTQNPAVGRYVNVYTNSGGDRFGHPLTTGSQNFASPAIGDLLNRNDGSREIVQLSEDNVLSAWDGNGTLLWRTPPTNGDQLGSPIIAPVGGACGSGNGVWIGGTDIVGLCTSQGTAKVMDLVTPGPSYAAPTVADLGNGHLSLISIYQNDSSNTSWTLGLWALPGTTTLGSGAWPTFHGSATRTGTPALVPDPRNRTFVGNLYHDVLGRTSPPGATELDFWQHRLDNGAYRSWLAMQLVGSSEAHGLIVDTDYQLMLGRAADAAGRAYWVGQLDAGVSNERLLGLLGGSDEYFAVRGHGDDATLVTHLYLDVLHRPANQIPAADVAYWVNRLHTGMSRAVIGDTFANSHEYHLALVATWYLHYLGRPVDSGGQNYWATGLDQGRKDDAGIVFLVSSDEYFGHPAAF